MKRSLIITLFLISCNMHSNNIQNHQENLNLKNNTEQIDTTINKNEDENASDITKEEIQKLEDKKFIELLQKLLELQKVKHELDKLQFFVLVVSVFLFGNIIAIMPN